MSVLKPEASKIEVREETKSRLAARSWHRIASRSYTITLYLLYNI